MKNKGIIHLLPLLLVVLVILAFIAGMFWSGQGIVTKSQPSPSPTPTPVFHSPAPTPVYVPLSERISLDIPDNEGWIKYNAKCEGLRQISFYYPSSWKLGLDGETSISDGPAEMIVKNKECFINLAYPMAPGGRQDPFRKGMYGYITVSASLYDKELIDLYNQFSSKDWISIIKKVNINDHDWIELRDDIYDEVSYVTNYNGWRIDVNMEILDANTIADESLNKLHQIEKEIIERVRFN